MWRHTSAGTTQGVDHIAVEWPRTENSQAAVSASDNLAAVSNPADMTAERKSSQRHDYSARQSQEQPHLLSTNND